jgi:hypothetical protein
LPRDTGSEQHARNLRAIVAHREAACGQRRDELLWAEVGASTDNLDRTLDLIIRYLKAEPLDVARYEMVSHEPFECLACGCLGGVPVSQPNAHPRDVVGVDFMASEGQYGGLGRANAVRRSAAPGREQAKEKEGG